MSAEAPWLFAPGKSGNPSGRPKVPEHVKELARAYTKEAIDTLGDIMKDPSATDSARVRAAESLLERAWGRAEQPVHVNTTENVRELSTAEILAALAAVGAIAPQAGADESRPVH